MLIYFFLTALANVLLNYYLLNTIEDSRALTFAQKKGAFAFYLVSALIGFIMIPIYMAIAVYVLFIEK